MSVLYHEDPQTKICAMCGMPKPLTNFHKMKSSSDGLRPSCKDCRRERIANPVPIVQQPLFVLERVCTKCGIKKDIEEFSKMTKGKDGYHPHCKQCVSQYNHQHRLDHLEEYKERSHVKNRRPEYKARRREKHRERSINDVQYLEGRKQQRSRYYRNHKEQSRDYAPRRKARMLSATVGEVDYARILERDGHFCYLCNKPIDPTAKPKSSQSLSFDHVVPLQSRADEPQGNHSMDNIKPAHHGCNVRKGNRPLETLTEYDRRGVD